MNRNLIVRFAFYLLSISVFVFSTPTFAYADGFKQINSAPTYEAQAQSGKTLRVGVCNSSPLIFMDENGTPQGFYIDVLNSIAKQENWTLEYVPCKWAECLAAVKSGQLDILPGAGYTEERAQKLDYTSEFLFLDWGVIYRNDGQTIDTFLDLEGKRIAAQKGSIYTDGLRSRLDQFGIHAEIITKSEYSDVLAAVNSGEADAGAVTEMYGLELEGNYDHIQQTDITFSPVKDYIVMPKGKHPEVLAALNKDLVALKADKTSSYYQSLNKWMGFYQKSAALPSWVIWSLAGLGALLVIALSFSLILRRQVAARTQSLKMEIEERKQAEESLRTSETRWRTLMQNLPSYVAEADPAGMVMALNRIQPGFRLEDYVGKSLFDTVAVDSREQFKEAFARVFEKNEMVEYEAPGYGANRQPAWYHRQLVPIVQDGEIRSILMVANEITERKKMEEALRASEDRYHAMFEQAGDGVFILDTNGKITSVNEMFARIHGYTAEEVLSKGLEGLDVEGGVSFHPERLDRILAGEILTFEVEHHHKSGHILSLSVTATLISSGGEQMIMAVHRDITERKQAEVVLRASEEKFRNLVKDMQVGVLLQGPQAEILLSNPKALEMLGLSEDQLLGKTSFDPDWNVIHEDGSPFPGHTHPVPQAIAARHPILNVVMGVYRPTTRSRVWLLVDAVPELGDHGTVQRVVCTFIDITARKQAEEALRESHIRYQLIFENSGTVNSIFDTECRLIMQNSLSIQNLGMNPDEALGKTALEVFGPGRGAAITERMQRVLASGVSEVFETEFNLPTGRKWFRSTYQPIFDEQRTLFGIQVVSQDITERKQAEEEIRLLNANLEQRVKERTQELLEAQERLVRQEKLAVLGQMAGSVGHELRNPLAVIANAIYFLKMIQPDASDKVKEYLDLIQKNVRISDKIVGDLLDFTRIKSAERKPIAVPELIHQTLERFPVPESITVELDLPDLPQIYVDPQQVVQVLGNLTLNACQAMSSTTSTGAAQSGQLTISSCLKENMICIAVQDTGVGISPENMKKLFEPLFTTKTKGIGLGLSVSKKLIEANGGSINVQSEIGVGSVFSVYLPIYRDKKESRLN